MEPPRKILIVRLSSLGDVLRDVVVLASLRAAYPGATIDWAIHTGFVDSIRHHPALSGAITIERSLFSLGNAGALFRAIRGLRERGYDLVVDCQGLLKSGLVTRGTGARRRVGFADAREGAWLAYTQRVDVGASVGGHGGATHHVDRRLALVRGLGVRAVADLRVYPGEEARAEAERDPRLAGARYVVVSPATRGLGRAWAVECFGALVARLVQEGPRLGIDAIVITGLASEREYCAPVLRAAGTGGSGGRAPIVVDRVGATNIGALMALVERARLVVCNDSAVMHLAVAFARPLVALLGPTRIEHAGPYLRSADVIQHRTPGEEVRHRDIRAARQFMERITLAEVFEACEARLSGAG